MAMSGPAMIFRKSPQCPNFKGPEKEWAANRHRISLGAKWHKKLKKWFVYDREYRPGYSLSGWLDRNSHQNNLVVREGDYIHAKDYYTQDQLKEPDLLAIYIEQMRQDDEALKKKKRNISPPLAVLVTEKMGSNTTIGNNIINETISTEPPKNYGMKKEENNLKHTEKDHPVVSEVEIKQVEESEDCQAKKQRVD